MWEEDKDTKVRVSRQNPTVKLKLVVNTRGKDSEE